jgi:hypothetical protein
MRCMSNQARRTFSANLAVSFAFARVVLICSCSKREVTRFLHSGQLYVVLDKRGKAHRSMSMRWEDVRENFRNAMPCFMVGV